MLDRLPLRHINVFTPRTDGYFPKRSLNIYKKDVRFAERQSEAQSPLTKDHVANLKQQLYAAEVDCGPCPRYYPGTLGSTYAGAAVTLATACLLGSGLAIGSATPATVTACLLAATALFLLASLALSQQHRRLPSSYQVVSNTALPGEIIPLCGATPATGGASAVEQFEKTTQKLRNGAFVAVKRKDFQSHLFASSASIATLSDRGVTSHDLAHEKIAILTTLQAPHAADPRYLEYGRSFASIISSDLAFQLCVSLDSLATIRDASQTRAALHHGWNVDWFNTFRSGLIGQERKGTYHLHGIAVFSIRDDIFLSAQGGACSAHLVSPTGYEVIYNAPLHETISGDHTVDKLGDTSNNANTPLKIAPTNAKKRNQQTVLRIPRSKFASASLVLSTHEAFDAALVQHGSQLHEWLLSLRSSRSKSEQPVGRLPAENENDYRGLLVIHPEFFAAGA